MTWRWLETEDLIEELKYPEMVPNRISTVIEELSDLEMVPNRRSNRRVKIPRDGSKQKSMVI